MKTWSLIVAVTLLCSSALAQTPSEVSEDGLRTGLKLCHDHRPAGAWDPKSKIREQCVLVERMLQELHQNKIDAKEREDLAKLKSLTGK